MTENKHKRILNKVECLRKSDSDIWIGVDCHKKNYSIAIWHSGRIVASWSMPRNHRGLIKMLNPLKDNIQRIVYEAGPTGFGFVRDLIAAGYPADVVATSKILRGNSSDPKTDNIDCSTLAEHASKGILKYIAIPTIEEEEDRQVVRLRDQLKKKRKSNRQQIKSFLLMHGIDEPEGLKDWLVSAVNKLRALPLSQGLRFTLDELLRGYDFSVNAFKRLNVEFKRIDKKHQKDIDIVKSHPGVGEVTSRKFITEIFCPGRFSNTKQIARYLGLAPNIHQSGVITKKKGVIPAGLTSLRCCIIEAAWAWLRQDDQIKEDYFRILKNSGKSSIAIVAIARKLGIHLWTMLMKRETYKTPEALKARLAIT